jgi:hypothetical protein
MFKGQDWVVDEAPFGMPKGDCLADHPERQPAVQGAALAPDVRSFHGA